MQTLSYGFKQPEAGDRGNIFFPALEDTIVLLNAHNHDGTNSAALNVIYLTKSSQTIAAASWVATTGGTYRQEVTMPAGITLLGFTLRFEISGGSTDGEVIFPSIEKGSAANKYYVYINDNTLTLRALYS